MLLDGNTNAFERFSLAKPVRALPIVILTYPFLFGTGPG